MQLASKPSKSSLSPKWQDWGEHLEFNGSGALNTESWTQGKLWGHPVETSTTKIDITWYGTIHPQLVTKFKGSLSYP